MSWCRKSDWHTARGKRGKGGRGAFTGEKVWRRVLASLLLLQAVSSSMEWGKRAGRATHLLLRKREGKGGEYPSSPQTQLRMSKGPGNLFYLEKGEKRGRGGDPATPVPIPVRSDRPAVSARSLTKPGALSIPLPTEERGETSSRLQSC